MTGFLRRHTISAVTLLFVIVSFQLMSMSVERPAIPRVGGRVIHAALAPIEKIHHEVVESLRYLWDRYLWLVDVEAERDELHLRVRALEAQNSRLIEFENENHRLRTLLSYQAITGLSGITAAVIGRDPSNWARTVSLDRGATDGVREGMPVVDGNAVVGQVISVTENASRVLLLTDNSSAVDILVQSSRAPGIAEGTLGRTLQLRYVLHDFAVSPGDRVIASGLDGVYPKGTLVGVVTSVESTTTGLFQKIEVQPSVDSNRLETVLIVRTGEVQ